MSLRFHFTLDLDWVRGSEAGVRSLLELSRRHELPTSLFVAGRFAEDYPEVLQDALEQGHEIGSHGWEHGQNNDEDFRNGSYESQKQWIRQPTDAIEKATGVRPVMFRAPNLWVSETTLRVLVEDGYQLDSSIPAQRFDFGYGQVSYTRYFKAPLAPYHPSEDHFGRSGESSLLEIAPSAFACVPINMSALRKFGFRVIAWAVRRLRKRSPVLVFYAHPSEFVAAEDQELPKDEVRRHRVGIGPQNLAVVERFIRYVLSLGYKPALISEHLHEDPADHK